MRFAHFSLFDKIVPILQKVENLISSIQNSLDKSIPTQETQIQNMNDKWDQIADITTLLQQQTDVCVFYSLCVCVCAFGAVWDTLECVYIIKYVFTLCLCFCRACVYTYVLEQYSHCQR